MTRLVLALCACLVAVSLASACGISSQSSGASAPTGVASPTATSGRAASSAPYRDAKLDLALTSSTDYARLGSSLRGTIGESSVTLDYDSASRRIEGHIGEAAVAVEWSDSYVWGTFTGSVNGAPVEVAVHRGDFGGHLDHDGWYDQTQSAFSGQLGREPLRGTGTLGVTTGVENGVNTGAVVGASYLATGSYGGGDFSLRVAPTFEVRPFVLHVEIHFGPGAQVSMVTTPSARKSTSSVTLTCQGIARGGRTEVDSALAALLLVEAAIGPYYADQ
jgi:hypothetical protein